MTTRIPRKVRYYDFGKNWSKRCAPHLADSELSKILVKDFNKFTWGRWRIRFRPGMFPADMETSCDWPVEHRGRRPRYWRYVKVSACHWLVNFALRLAMLAEPQRQWRIIASDKHSAVWDGRDTLFDLQYYSLGVDPKEARKKLEGGVELEPSQYLRVGFAEHWKTEERRRRSAA